MFHTACQSELSHQGDLSEYFSQYMHIEWLWLCRGDMDALGRKSVIIALKMALCATVLVFEVSMCGGEILCAFIL